MAIQFSQLKPTNSTSGNPLQFSQLRSNQNKPLPIASKSSSSFFGNLGTSLKDVATGAVKGGIDIARGTAQMLQGAGQRIISDFSRKPLAQVQKETGFQSLNDNSEVGKGVTEDLRSKNVGEQTGNILTNVATILEPFSSEIGGAEGIKNDINAIKKPFTSTFDYLKENINNRIDSTKSMTENLFGKVKNDIKIAQNDPIAQEFKSGIRTLSDTGNKIKSGITSFIENGKKALNTVFDQLPKNISVKTSDIIDAVNTGMGKVVGALEKSSGATLNDINDLLTKTKFSPDEQKIVSNLVDKVNTYIKNPENTSPRGLAELRRILYEQFNRGDGSLSDQVVSKINTELKNLITSSSKEFGPALGNAVDNIDKAEQISKQFLDKNGNIIESKLASFANKLKDPALGADAKALFQNILGKAGSDIQRELEGFNNSKILKLIEQKGEGLLGKGKNLLKKGAVVGGILAGGKATYDVLKGKP